MNTRSVFALAAVFITLWACACSSEFREMELGKDYQNTHTKEPLPVQRLALDADSESILLLSKHCLDQTPYNSARTNIT